MKSIKRYVRQVREFQKWLVERGCDCKMLTPDPTNQGRYLAWLCPMGVKNCPTSPRQVPAHITINRMCLSLYNATDVLTAQRIGRGVRVH